MSVRPTHNPVSARLKARRKARGLTQEQLAERLGVTHGTVSRLETGRISASQDMLLALARALDCSVGALLGEELEGEVSALWRRIPATERAQALKTLKSFVREDEPAGFEAEAPKPTAKRRKPKR